MSIESLLDPELQQVLSQLPNFPDIAADPPATRQMLAELITSARGSATNDQVRMENRKVEGLDSSVEVPVRIYWPRDRPPESRGGLLWIHGGGFVLGNLDQDDVLCQQVVEQTGCVVVSVDYRLAPEHPFPAAADDCYAALVWMQGVASELGVDSHRLVVGGASAGGGLSAAVALMARDRGGPSLALQLLIYPMLDDRNDTPSSHTVTDPRLFHRKNVAACWNAYLGGRHEDVSPSAAPSRATSLADLAPAYVVVADRDNLRDECIDYARRLTEAGVDTELHVYPGTFHGFDILAPAAQVSQRAIADYVGVIGRAVDSHTQWP